MSRYTKRFIVFSQEELDKIKNGEIVALENCSWAKGIASKIYCVSKEWMQDFDSDKNLP